MKHLLLNLALAGALYGQIEQISVGGPSNKGVEVQCDLPVSLRMRNTGGSDGPRGPGSGSGLCVFTSIQNAARYQNETRLWNFQSQMTHEPGGGYPGKVDKMIAKYGAGTPYLQYEGKDPALLKAALATGRMPCITYNGHDPHYGMGTGIAHMTNLVCWNDEHDLCCVLDNNYIGENQLVWMSREEFVKRWQGNGGGWAVFLLAPPPPPPPRN